MGRPGEVVMLLYLESQLANAYRVYMLHIPAGSKAMSIEEFRTEMENDEETFELLLAEFENLPNEQRHTH